MKGDESREASIFAVTLMQLLVWVLLFLALLHVQKTLIITAVLILALMYTARIWSRMSLSRVTCLSTVDKKRLFPGERVTLKIRVENVKFLPIWLQVNLPSATELVPSPEGASSPKQSGLLGYQGAHFKWKLDALKRGIYQVGPPRLRIGDFLGFFLRERKEFQTLDIIVYPKLVPLKKLPLPRRDFFGVPGIESPVQDPIYILGTRDYQHNQPARHIHWKASARHGRLQEKTFETTAQEKVLLILEVDQFTAKGASDEFERTLEVMASLAVQLDHKGYPLGFATNGILKGEGPPCLPVARGPQQLSSILEILARVRMAKKERLIDVLHNGLSLAWGVSCVHFSYHQDASTLTTENYLASRRTQPLFVLCRYPEASADEYRIKSRICCLDDLQIGETVEA